MTTIKNTGHDTPLRPDDFVADSPQAGLAAAASPASGPIEGVTVTTLVPHGDGRGQLTELLTTPDGPIEPIIHVYEVEAKAGSVRGWVYHRHQFDRLAFTRGEFRIALYDLRPDSPTSGKLFVTDLGRKRPSLLRIPPFVVHGVKNTGSEDAVLINMPTKVYDPMQPDKYRLPLGDPRIPFSFGG